MTTRQGSVTQKLYAVMATLLFAAVLAQFFLAAMGAFNPAPTEEAFSPHRALGYSIFLLALLIALFGAVARMPGRLIGMAGLAAGLVLVQVVIAEVSKGIGDDSTVGRLIFGLHAINGLFVMGVTETVARRSRAIARKAPEQAADETSLTTS